MTCRKCHKQITVDYEPVEMKRVAKFDDCVFRCSACRIGYSNARDEHKRVLIHEHYEDNVPDKVRDGLHEVLTNALNHTNQKSKMNRFAFETSEDALTWTVIKYLSSYSLISHALANLLGNKQFEGRKARVLLWGAPTDNIHLAQPLVPRLINVSDSLGENKDRRSEPDVIVDFADEGCIFIEAKYRSRNEKQPKHKNFNRYLDSAYFAEDFDQIKNLGYYELARNWRIGAEFAGNRPFYLVNLVQHRDKGISSFTDLLKQTDKRAFREHEWVELLNASNEPHPQWLQEYLASRSISL